MYEHTRDLLNIGKQHYYIRQDGFLRGCVSKDEKMTDAMYGLSYHLDQNNSEINTQDIPRNMPTLLQSQFFKMK